MSRNKSCVSRRKLLVSRKTSCHTRRALVVSRKTYISVSRRILFVSRKTFGVSRRKSVICVSKDILCFPKKIQRSPKERFRHFKIESQTIYIRPLTIIMAAKQTLRFSGRLLAIKFPNNVKNPGKILRNKQFADSWKSVPGY